MQARPSISITTWAVPIFGILLSFGRSVAAECPPGPAFRACIEKRVEAVTDRSSVRTLEELVGTTSRELALGPLHRRGRSSLQLFRVRGADGGARLIKIIRPNKASGHEGQLVSEVTGMLLQNEVGGPAVYGAGRVAFDGGIELYVEMEEFFSEQLDTFTSKGLVDQPRRVRPRLTELQLRWIAARAREALVRNYVVSDPDLVFDARRVRWIDGAKWRISKTDFAAEDAEPPLTSYADLVGDLTSIDEATGLFFIAALRREVFTSEEWTLHQRQRVWSRLRKSFSDYGFLDARVIDQARESLRPNFGAFKLRVRRSCEKYLDFRP